MKRFIMVLLLVLGFAGRVFGWVTGDQNTFALPGGASIVMVYIGPGTFTMGSSDSLIAELNSGALNCCGWRGYFSNEGPQHEVTLTQGFWLGKYEVTEKQYHALVGTGGNSPTKAKANVLYSEAQDYISKLNEVAGDSVWRLPTEAEWEFAVRAGTTTAWFFGDNVDSLGNYAVHRKLLGEWRSWHGTVGTKLPSPWGLYDVYGNVSELVQDRFGPYSSGAQTDPQGPGPGEGYGKGEGSWMEEGWVMRGGSWIDDFWTEFRWRSRSAFRMRDFNNPLVSGWVERTGIRLARRP